MLVYMCARAYEKVGTCIHVANMIKCVSSYHVFMHVRMQAPACNDSQKDMYVAVHVHAHVQLYGSIHITHACVYIYMCIYMCIYIHVYVQYKYIYTHIHMC